MSPQIPGTRGRQDKVDDDVDLLVNRRDFLEALEELHNLCPLDDPSDPTWDLWIRFSKLRRSK